jgi:hypothetical protein
MENETTRFLGPESDWEACALDVDDVHGFWGGRRLRLDGRGSLRVEIHPGGRVFQGQVESDRVIKILRRACRLDLLGVPEPPRHIPVPDETSASVTLYNADGAKRRRGCWARAPIAAVVEVYHALLDLEATVLKGPRPVRVFRK